MKLSRREKVLIVILVIALAVYAGYMFIPSSGMFNLDELRAEHSRKTLEYATMSQNITLKNKYEEDALTLIEQINNLPVISDLQQEKLIVFLNKYLADNNIDASNITFTDAAAVPMSIVVSQPAEKAKSSMDLLMYDIDNIYVYADENEDDEQAVAVNTEEADKEEQPSMSAESISVNIEFLASYNDMIKFIDLVQANPVDISITNISTVASEVGTLQGTMTMNFYEVPKPVGFKENNDEWLWNDLAESGKANPFSIGGAWETIGSLNTKFDFFVNLEPESSDLPTILVGKTEDIARSTYISENTNTVENIKFSFKLENNKYYYSYNTKNNTYPKSGTWQEFSPSEEGKIKIKVYSSDRNLKTDSVGAIIGVTNTSGLKVYFEVENDSSTNPRVTLKDAKSAIVTRK
ncbi:MULTISPECIES: hypothetical protein [unclassified Sedimentibacter]|uniref:hypothetical protein n=1 Tax=unclassified Sedimentibacter TaxID=2649220 RepID=UPI0027DFD5E1|nr:hypothetical protein [Sedimentibacter sp. MB35-C1]WMJ76671.1 hypothetical protein RBQ61_13915 [Sedimentibacter sp. MB35-C1]